MISVQQIAGWDTAALGRRCVDLVDAVEAAGGWVIRGDAIAVSLVDGWEGLGHDAAVARLRTWLAVTARAGAAAQTLADDLVLAVQRYTSAQAAADTALTLAGREGLRVEPDGTLIVDLPTAAEVALMAPDQVAVVRDRELVSALIRAEIDEALLAAARGDALLASALRVFTRHAVPGFVATSGFGDLLAAVGVRSVGVPPALPPVPTGATPGTVAAWWAMLPADVQARLARERPQQIGALDGVSSWARDVANRIVLEQELRTATGAELARLLEVRASLRRAGQDGSAVQLILLGPGGHRAAVAVGDLDAADAVAMLVPGTGVTVDPDLTSLVDDATTLRDAGLASHAEQAVAAVAWLGYDTPMLWEAPFPGPALTAGPLLSTALAGLAANRRTNRPRTTVLGHSYGTAVISAAAAQPGRLQADSVVLMGSPGTLADHAADFEVDPGRVFVADADRDWVAQLSQLDIEVFGPDPSYQRYGSVCIAADMPDPSDSDHFHYYDEHSEALDNAANIVTGRYSAVQSRPCDRPADSD